MPGRFPRERKRERMAKGRVVYHKQPPAGAPRSISTTGARRRKRRHPWLRLLAAVLALGAAAGAVYGLWLLHPAHDDQLLAAFRPQAAEAAPAQDAAAPAEDPADAPAAPGQAAAVPPVEDGRVVVAVDPGHGGVNPNIGAEDLGSEANGLREVDITYATAQALADLLEADGRFAPLLTADGSAYVKPSARGAAAKAAGAQLLVSIHLNYDASAEPSGFECYAAPPALATNADSVRFGELLVEAFGQLGLRIRGNTGVRYLYYDANDNKVILESTDTTPRSDPTFTVLSSCGCPAVLCEEGFISNAGDMALLAGDDGCRQAAERYYQCICAYFGLEPLP